MTETPPPIRLLLSDEEGRQLQRAIATIRDNHHVTEPVILLIQSYHDKVETLWFKGEIDGGESRGDSESDDYMPTGPKELQETVEEILNTRQRIAATNERIEILDEEIEKIGEEKSRVLREILSYLVPG